MHKSRLRGGLYSPHPSVRILIRIAVFVRGYRLARRNNYSIRTAWRFARLSVYEHPTSVKKDPRS